MSRTCYDSVTAADIPTSAAMVMGYVDGRYAWSAADWARFPAAAKVRVAVSPRTNDGDFLDVETGDATPADTPGWIRMRRAAGHPNPGLYFPISSKAAIDAALGSLRPVPYWSAHYRSSASTPPFVDAGCVATQYANAATSGGHYDLSLVVDDLIPYTTPAPQGAKPMHSWFAYDPGFSGGVASEAVDLDGDGQPYVVTGAGPGGGPHVKVWKLYVDGSVHYLGGFMAYDPRFTGGIASVSIAKLPQAGKAMIVTSPGAGGGPNVRSFMFPDALT